ncbi:hypothetical protein BAP_3840 [Bacillus sp. CN2]|nr:hypothetical protein BAP_3840 [Bacillus sp. CN2]
MLQANCLLHSLPFILPDIRQIKNAPNTFGTLDYIRSV